MLFALIFPRAQRGSTYDISAERNVWLQSALRSFAIVCDYMETGLFAIVCDPRSSAIVCDRLRSYGTSLYKFMPDRCFRMLMVTPSGSGKTNLLLDLIYRLLYYDKIYVCKESSTIKISEFVENIGTN